MKEINIQVKKTVRYCQIGEITEHTSEIIFVLHGYGQLAKFFIQKFKSITNNTRVIIAPEGMHRYYRNGNSGRVGASWMTKEAREDDIKDYVNMLDSIYMQTVKQNSVQVKIIGFSQGVATVCRWVTKSQLKFDKLILWAGIFPLDLNWEEDVNKINALNPTLLLGNEDEFIGETDFNNADQLFRSKGISFEYIPFNGKHDVYPEPLSQLFIRKD